MNFMYLDSQFSLPKALLLYLGFLIAITMSQAIIAIVAKKRGDVSVQTRQMATLNPLPHIELIGTVIFPFIAIFLNSPVIFGWPKQFNIESRYFKKPKRDVNLVYASGIIINFIIALICMLVLKFMGPFYIAPTADHSSPEILSRIILSSICYLNVVIGALNLLPIPGTPGWYILINSLSYDLSRKLQEKAMLISIGFMVLIISGLFNSYFSLFISLFNVL
ncbi:site-2 protease family protein [Silvanigrella aquatica]|uniref:Peptidase M50 domain-containing protein n=1 Tax=Silvanigrella aquatica TaxID=1915309 RepID=A0A1L4CY31_9BACT|nr:site-2 protease family protein [Silvanigrella aquatica]APJ02847.1 hypothetical protein AXG55_02495 [Silvanigrella aquatica]